MIFSEITGSSALYAYGNSGRTYLFGMSSHLHRISHKLFTDEKSGEFRPLSLYSRTRKFPQAPQRPGSTDPKPKPISALIPDSTKYQTPDLMFFHIVGSVGLIVIHCEATSNRLILSRFCFLSSSKIPCNHLWGQWDLNPRLVGLMTISKVRIEIIAS